MKKILAFSVGIIIGIILTVAGYHDLRDSKRLAAEGKSTVGKVTHHYSYKPRRGSRKYYVTVAFETDKKEGLEQEVRVSSSTYDHATGSGTVTVHYLPSDPEVMQAGSKIELQYGGLVTGLLIFIFSAGTWIFYRGTTMVIARKVNALCEQQGEYRAVDPQAFKKLDLGFYDYVRREMEARSYRFLEDTEQARQGRGEGVFFRTLVGPDNATLGVCYHMKVPAFLRMLGAKDAKVVEFYTAFNNGHYVITSNADAAGKLDYPAVMDTRWLADGTALPLVQREHEKHLASFREKHAGVEPVPIGSASDMHRMQHDLDRIKSEFRKSHGLSKAELQRIAGEDGGEAMTILHQDVAKEHGKQFKKAA